MRFISVVGVSFSIASGLLAGCNSDGGQTPRDPVTGDFSARLQRAANCGDLLSKIQLDAIAKLDQLAAQLKQHGGLTGQPGAGVGGSTYAPSAVSFA